MWIGRDALCGLIPHAGSMCLLDAVTRWDARQIRCVTDSHRRADNPLRRDGQLSAVHALEYAAQAMAVHGGLTGRPQTPAYLAAARDVRWQVARLDTLAESLEIFAQCLLADSGNLIYAFSVTTASQGIATGRATVMTIRR